MWDEECRLWNWTSSNHAALRAFLFLVNIKRRGLVHGPHPGSSLYRGCRPVGTVRTMKNGFDLWITFWLARVGRNSVLAYSAECLNLAPCVAIRGDAAIAPYGLRLAALVECWWRRSPVDATLGLALSWETIPHQKIVNLMKPLPLTLLLASLAFGLAACAEIKESGNRLEESHLRQAGFKIMLADRADRQQMLNSLTPDTVTRLAKDGNVYYIYPDPDGCVCLYVGREAEYRRLQQIAVDLQVSNRQLLYNDMAASAQNGWGPMGPWGSWGNYTDRPNWDPY